MDYNYIHLQNQIKALMNKNYVPSSSHAASATELKNGSNSFLVDTVQKFFVFKYAGLNESVMVDPINRKLLNVAYINGVDVSKLIGGVMAGYGITIENQGDGVYKIRATDEMFALKSDVEDVNDKLGDYVTNEELNTKLGDEFINDETLTIAKFVKDGDDAINDKLTNDYYTKIESDGKYALKSDTYTKTESDERYALSENYELFKLQADEKFVHVLDFNGYAIFCDEKYVLKREGDEKYALKSDTYTKTESDGKYALKTHGYIDKIMSMVTSSSGSSTDYNASVGDRIRLGVSIGGGAAQYHTVTLTDAIKTEEGQKFVVGANYINITFTPAYNTLSFKPNSSDLVISSIVLEVPDDAMYRNECDNKYALKTDGCRSETMPILSYGENQWEIMDPYGWLAPGEQLRVCTRINGGYAYYHLVTLTDAINTEAGQKFQVDSYTLTFTKYYDRFFIKSSSASLVVASTNLETAPNYVMYRKECDNLYKSKNSSTTITHYAPIEGDIDEFKVGLPVFASGKVFNRVQNEWIPSTVNDRKDCISSVQLMGNHKTYLGVIVDIDKENNSITFASHGDFMFNVEESNLYEVGDVVLYDGRILEDDIIVTSAHLQSVVGKITAIIDEHTLALFKN